MTNSVCKFIISKLEGSPTRIGVTNSRESENTSLATCHLTVNFNSFCRRLELAPFRISSSPLCQRVKMPLLVNNTSADGAVNVRIASNQHSSSNRHSSLVHRRFAEKLISTNRPPSMSMPKHRVILVVILDHGILLGRVTGFYIGSGFAMNFVVSLNTFSRHKAIIKLLRSTFRNSRKEFCFKAFNVLLTKLISATI